MSYILAQRTDGLGCRLNAILNAMFLANELGGLKFFKFIYTSRGNEKNLKSFEGNEIVRGSCDDLSSIFDDEFIKNHYLDVKSLKDKSSISVTEYKDMKSLKKAFEKGDYEFFSVPIGFLHWYIQDIDFGYYREQTTLMFLKKIAFEKKIKQVIEVAQKKL